MRAILKSNTAAQHISRRIARSGDGFTLIELIVVIAILGILIAIAVPTIRGFLESSREQAYEADHRVIQLAVDAYYYDIRNERTNNVRQYPIVGKRHQSPTPDERTWKETNARLHLGECEGADRFRPIVFKKEENVDVLEPHPVLGTRGGTPIWQEGTGDNHDGLRTDPEDGDLYCPASEGPGTGADERPDHWVADVLTNEGENCPDGAGACIVIDSRDYLIDFCELVRKRFLEDIPQSASADHTCPLPGGDADETTTADGERGSYTWYVDRDGKVKSLYYFLPTEEGYQDVYP